MTESTYGIDPHLYADPYLQGNYAPVHEEIDVANLPVDGELPPDLEGIYMRNGPNPAFDPISYTYPFDGDGMIHTVYFDKGRARYRNRWVKTKGLKAEQRAGRALYGGLFNPGPIDPSLVGPDGDPGPIKNVANTSVIQHGGHILALFEGGLPYDLSSDLETAGEWDYEGKLVSNMTAHPRFDPSTGELHFFRYDVQPPFLTYYVADGEANIRLSCPIDLPQPVMMHDFVITEQHVVFFACPAVFDVQAMMRGGQPLVWKPELGTRIGVLQRGTSTATVRWLDTDPFFVYHFMNAFEEGESIHIDYVRRSSFFVGGADAKERGEFFPPTLHRLTLDFSTNTVRDRPLGDEVVEFPKTDVRVGGQRYRFGYTVMTEQSTVGHHQAHSFSGIVQYDVSTEASTVHRYGAGRYPGEPCFVPRPGSNSEEDGYVVSYVYDEASNKSDLVILDASRFADDPVAVIHLPVRVPNGLHGSWMAV